MSFHMHSQIEKLKVLILSVGTMVETALRNAAQAVEKRDVDLAKRIIAGDHDIDMKEIEIEEECLSTLALHQPVAHDLRFVVAVLKINNDLERVGDLANNIAGHALALADGPAIDTRSLQIDVIAQKSQRMLKQSLDALVQLDVVMAEKVLRMDDEVDEIHRKVYDKVEHQVRTDIELLGPLIRQLTIVRHYERIADHAVNIAEDVIYLVQGRIVRHPTQRPKETV